MTRLRKLMLDELERRNYTQTTRRAYLLGVANFARHFHRSPDQLGLDHVRDYQVYLLRERKLKPNTVAVRRDAQPRPARRPAPVATGTAPSARPTPATAGCRRAAPNCCPRAMSTSFSPCRTSWLPSR